MICSVIVPVYNGEKYIGRCLRSLLSQTGLDENYEVIVVNDGSRDRTEYAVSQFAEGPAAPIVSIKLERNRGLPYALNTGLKSARGKYILRVDADDFVNKNIICFLSSYLQANQQLGAVACDYFLVKDTEEIIERKNCLADPIGCGIMFRRDTMMQVGMYDERFRVHEDKEFMHRFEKFSRVDRLPIPLYRYRQHEGGITKNESEAKHYKKLLNQVISDERQ